MEQAASRTDIREAAAYDEAGNHPLACHGIRDDAPVDAGGTISRADGVEPRLLPGSRKRMGSDGIDSNIP